MTRRIIGYDENESFNQRRSPVEAREQRRPATTPDYERNGSPRIGREDSRSVKRRSDHYFGDQG